jgi:coproporphyrinogen III oxidase
MKTHGHQFRQRSSSVPLDLSQRAGRARKKSQERWRPAARIVYYIAEKSCGHSLTQHPSRKIPHAKYRSSCAIQIKDSQAAWFSGRFATPRGTENRARSRRWAFSARPECSSLSETREQTVIPKYSRTRGPSSEMARTGASCPSDAPRAKRYFRCGASFPRPPSRGSTSARIG